MESKCFRLLSRVGLVPLLFALFSPAVSGQTVGGTLLGKVTDTSGAILPGVVITIRNVATGLTRSVLTNETGVFQAPSLQPGTYDVSAQIPAFSQGLKKNITLNVGGEMVLDFQLSVEGSTQTVDVQAEPSIDLVASTVSRTVEGTTIRELPLNGRDWTQLAALEPGISAIGSGGGAGRDGSGVKLTVSGARPTENNFRLDGVSLNDNSNNTPGSILGTNMGVEAVREFSVVSNNYSAEYGRATGGVINAVTKSGTNDVHGTLFYFGRNSALDARNFFDGSVKPSFRRHQFGGAVGGPIVQNRTFWFANFEGLNQFLATTTITNTLSDSARQGQLSTGVVSVDSEIARVFPLLPLPNGSLLGAGDTGQFIALRDTPSRGRYALGKIDHKISNADSLSGSYLFDDAKSESPDGFHVKRSADTSRKQVVSLAYTRIVSPAVLSVSGVGFSRSSTMSGTITQVLNSLLEDSSLGFIPGLNIGSISVPGISFTGNGPGGSNGVTRLIFNSFQGHEDLYITHGKHSIKMGANVERMQFNLDLPRLNGGSFTFGSLSDFLRNRPSSFGALIPGSDTIRGLRQTLIAGYVQDDLRWKPNFSINIGLRYEFVTIPGEVNEKIALVHSYTDSVVKVGGPIFDRNPTRRNFAPRIGIVWDPFKDGKTSIRSGFGVFDSLPLLWLFDTPLVSSTPIFLQGVITPPPAGTYPSQAFPLLQVQNLRTAYIEPNPGRAYSLKWDLDIQRQVHGWVVEAGYTGSRGVHLPLVERNMNVVLPIQTASGWVVPAGAQKLNPNFATVNTTDTWNADSYYHGMQWSLKKSWRQGVQFQESYTWSKSIDTASSSGSTNATSGYSSAVGLVSPLLPWLNRGLSDFDVPHNSVTSIVWELPFGRSMTGPLGALLSSWQISSIYKVQSGTPFSAVLSADRAGTLTDTTGTSLGQRPNLVVSDACRTLTNPDNPNNWIKAECFTFPAQNTLGNLGRNTMRKDGISNLDISLSKKFKTSERVNTQLRMELFNALNHTNFAAPNTVMFDNQGRILAPFGRVTSTSTESRRIQLALKLNF